MSYIFEQEEVNKKLIYIYEELLKIRNVNINHVEYIGVILYVLYENLDEWNQTNFSDTMYIMRKLEEQVLKIQEEQEKDLFINIQFVNIFKNEEQEQIKEVTEKLKELINEVNERKKIADAYEYIIMQHAKNGGLKNASGEFYTPKGLIKTMVGIANIKDKTSIYNPASSTGNFIVECARHGEIYALGEERDNSSYNICVTNIKLHEVDNVRIIKQSVGVIPLMDVAIANPPFVEQNDILNNQNQSKFPQKMSGYIKFLLKMLENIGEDGKIVTILPKGFLYKRVNEEYRIRRGLIENNYIDTIIELPEKLFYATKIQVIILVIKKRKKTNDVLFINASNDYTSKRKNNILTIEHQNKIISTYNNRKKIEGYSYIANYEEIQKEDFNLRVDRYVKTKVVEKNIKPKEIEDKIRILEKKKKNIDNQIENILKDVKKY